MTLRHTAAGPNRNLDILPPALHAGGLHLDPSHSEHNSGALRPVIKWAGGKRSLLPVLRHLAPIDFRTYYEPFFGGGSFFFALAPERAVLGDANAELIGLYAAIRDFTHETMRALDELQPYVEDSDSYYRIRDMQPSTLPPPERAARFIFLNKAGFNGLYRVNRRGKFNVPFGTHASRPTLYEPANFVSVAALLRKATLKHGDFEQILAEAGEGDFAYLDPPYVPLTATSSFTQYTAGSFGESDQRRLAESVRGAVARGCSVLISNSDSPLARELYAGYKIHVIHANRNINSNGAKRQKITELAIQASPA